MKQLLYGLTCLPVLAHADVYTCAGTDPDWLLTLNETDGQFDFDNRMGRFDVMLQTLAEGRAWPQAFTLISSADTAIVLIDQRACGTDEYAAEILTQRGTTAVLLTGCCDRRVP